VPAEIRAVAAFSGHELPPDLEIIEPSEVRKRYVAPRCCNSEKHKATSAESRQSMLEDNVVLGTMMSALTEATSGVGCDHTTPKNTRRPALTGLIIDHNNGPKVSVGISFMLLPQRLWVLRADLRHKSGPQTRSKLGRTLPSRAPNQPKAFGIEASSWR